MPRLPFELQEGETILVACRRHPVKIYPKLAWFAILAVVPIVALTWVVSLATDIDGAVALVLVLVSVAWMLAWGLAGYFAWYRYRNDIWFVTNQRIVDSLRRHWFHHQMASADLVDVEDIALHKGGLLGTLLNFGDVRCQTAGSQPNFIMGSIREPGKVMAIVDAARDAARKELARPF
jgi:hypothetical protein